MNRLLRVAPPRNDKKIIRAPKERMLSKKNTLIPPTAIQMMKLITLNFLNRESLNFSSSFMIFCRNFETFFWNNEPNEKKILIIMKGIKIIKAIITSIVSVITITQFWIEILSTVKIGKIPIRDTDAIILKFFFIKYHQNWIKV